MLFRQDSLDGIREGRITLAFRRWRRPTVRTGGTLMLPIDQLQIVEVRQIADGDIEDLTDDDVRRPALWTRRVLELIRDNPAVRAADLCRAVEMERLPFKASVRKLKALGLTESLDVGYRLSPRGAAVLRAR
jgi:hypothetical protein